MKKKFFIFSVVILLISVFYKILVWRNVKNSPIKFAFFRPNGSYVGLGTIARGLER